MLLLSELNIIDRRDTNTLIKLAVVRISGHLCTSPSPSFSVLDRLPHASPCILYSILLISSYFLFKVDGKLCAQNGIVITLTLIMGIICCLICLHEKFNRGFLPPATFFIIIVFYLITSLLTNPSNVCFHKVFQFQPIPFITFIHHFIPRSLSFLSLLGL